MENYKKEVDIMKKLCTNTNINMIQYIADGAIVSNSVYFIDMELCDINLSEYIGGTRKVTGVHGLPLWNKENPDIFLITTLMQQLLSGLKFMHEQGKVHRDLDPRNGNALCVARGLIFSVIFGDGWVVENRRPWVDVRRNDGGPEHNPGRPG
jgi:serine/threonine protein kinase